MERFELYDPYWIEEPFFPDDIDNHARLAKLTRVPVATGEIGTGRWHFKEILDKGGAQILQTDAFGMRRGHRVEENCRHCVELRRHRLPALVSRPARAACSGYNQRALTWNSSRRPGSQFSASHRYAAQDEGRHADSTQDAGPRI